MCSSKGHIYIYRTCDVCTYDTRGGRGREMKALYPLNIPSLFEANKRHGCRGGNAAKGSIPFEKEKKCQSKTEEEKTSECA